MANVYDCIIVVVVVSINSKLIIYFVSTQFYKCRTHTESEVEKLNLRIKSKVEIMNYYEAC